MYTSPYMLLGACQYCPRHCGVRPIKMQPFCASQQAASIIFTETGDFSTFRQPTKAASARRSRACLPCACLWTSTCLCLTALFRRASTHILRAFYSADIGIPLTQPPTSALRALCLRSWPASWTVSLDLTASSRRYSGFISSFQCQRSYLTVIIVSEMHSNAFQCIAQPNTALHDCTLYTSQYL